MKRKPYPADIYLSPPFMIKRFIGLRKKHGDKFALTKDDFKPEREGWITAVFLLGIIKISNRSFWLRPNSEKTTPDTITISFTDSDKGVIAEMQNVEIFEYESHAVTDIVGAVKQKLLGKAYPKDYILLCYVHGHEGEIFNTLNIYERVKKLNPKIGEIWILANLLGPKSTEHVIFQVFPVHNLCKIDYIKECKKSRQEELIQISRGKSDKVEFTPLGKYYLELP